MEYIIHFFESIAYYLHLFFFCTVPFTHIFKIVLILQLLLLLYAAIRPSKWKWITLFASEVAYFVGAFAVIGIGAQQDELGILGYGIIAVIMCGIMFFATLGCSLRTPKASTAEK